jgi:8-oxo-dGTP pyrophosphatase MutT (NUDIX family)
VSVVLLVASLAVLLGLTFLERRWAAAIVPPSRRGRGPAYTRRVSTAAPPPRPCPPAPAALPPLDRLSGLLARLLAARTRRRLEVPGRRAAVLIVLYEREGDVRLMLTKRTDTLAHHKGQVSLPGGRYDPEDVDLVTTALREAEEEVGIPRGDVRVLGETDDVATIATDFLVTPVVGALSRPPRPVPNPHEIARVMEVSLAEVLALDAALPAGLGPLELRYPLDGEDVWGATARILRDFCRIARCALAAPAASHEPHGGIAG